MKWAQIKRKCTFCKKVFSGTRWYIKNRKFCSHLCYSKNEIGKVISGETRKKLSISQLGEKNSAKRPEVREKIRLSKINLPKETRRKMSEAGKKRIGSLNSNWRGGITPERLTFAYKIWRRKILVRDNYICQICGDRNYKGRGSSIKLHVDHIKPFWKYPELVMEMNNGRVLCVGCHRNTDTFGGKKRNKLGRFVRKFSTSGIILIEKIHWVIHQTHGG